MQHEGAVTDYKSLERVHADAHAARVALGGYVAGQTRWTEGIALWARGPYEVCEQQVIDHCGAGARLLDFGCGQAGLSLVAARRGAHVEGIDIAPKAVEVANEKARREGLAERAHYAVGDCEHLAFPTGHFDAAVSINVLPAIDVDRGLSELARVLKPTGWAAIADTFGHNPLANANRWLNARRGIRTRHQTAHILRMADLGKFSTYFASVDVRFFDVTTLVVGAVLGHRRGPVASALVRASRAVDRILLARRPLQRYAFKIAVILSEPKR
jgi:2-polyprenyl-3-methyl-5-hydroxy-6-metoxy-1,4-benzoquinol methylase